MKPTTKSEPVQNAKPVAPKNDKPVNNDKLFKMLDKQNKNENISTNIDKIPVDKVGKEKKIMKILKYLGSKRFGAKLKSELGIKYTRPQLLKCSNDNLDAILFRIRNYLNTRNMDMVFEQMARYTAKGYEDLVSNFYDIEGFSDLLMQNPAFWDAFERWKIEHEMPDVPPSVQMMYIIASTTYIAHLQKQVKIRHVPTNNDKKASVVNNKSNKPDESDDKPKIIKLKIGDEL